MMRRVSNYPYEPCSGRGTYEIFAAHWPYDEGPIADQLNSTRKHVAFEDAGRRGLEQLHPDHRGRRRTRVAELGRQTARRSRFTAAWA